MFPYQFSPFAVPAALTVAAVMACAVAIILKRVSRPSVALLGVGVAAAVWELACAFMYLATDPQVARIWAKAGLAFAGLVAPAVYQYAVEILPPAERRRIVAVIAWMAALQMAVVTVATGYLVDGVSKQWWGFYPHVTRAGQVLYPLVFLVVLAAAALEASSAYRNSKNAERMRARILLVAIGIGSLGAVDVLPIYGISVFPFGWAALLTCTAVILYGVKKHGMVEITPTVPAADIIGTMRDLLLVSDPEGRILFANNAACTFLGYPREDILGMRLEDLLAPISGSAPGSVQGWARDREYVFRTKMGQPIELTLSHSPLTRHGEPIGTVIIGRDLRERKRYEWEARRAVTLLESTLDSTADGILVIAQDGRVVTWNQRFADLWGIPPEVMEQEDDHDLIGQLIDHLNDPAEFLLTLAALHEHPEAESMHMLQLKDGRRLEQYSIGRYLDDQLLRVWSFRDVTARLAAEEALRDSEGRYRLLFEQNAAGVCLAEISGRLISCNATFAGMVGYTVEELADRQIRDVFERPSTLEDIRRRLAETPTVSGMEIDMRRRDGARVAGLSNISLLGSGDTALVHLTIVDISDRKRAEEQIEFQAYHDALTQLPNRRLFVERLELSLLTAKRARGNVGVLFIDLDRFKTINDTLGHSVADALLVEIAQRLRTCVRQTDTVARYGGDEFTIILPDLYQPEDAAQVAEKILERVVEPVVAGTTAVEISVSIGIAVFPYDGTDIDTLLRNADDAMYRAKQAGRNTYQLCTEQMKTRAMERLSMQSRLRKAMTEDELVLAYEPQVSLATGQVVGAEAVIRWKDPERGVIEPRDFIPLAEETRLIVPLGEWALFTACRQLRQWRDDGLPSVRMAVNISARHFQQRDLARVVRRAIDEAGIDPTCLEIEIRETTAMRDVDLTVELLNLLRDAGVTIAIDDFGSAYSALGSLRILPINAVKIDRGLLDHMTAGEGDLAIISAVIGVSHSLGLRIAADGVDTREQFEFLKARGCQEAQGSYCSPALDPDSFKSRLRSALDLHAPNR